MSRLVVPESLSRTAVIDGVGDDDGRGGRVRTRCSDSDGSAAQVGFVDDGCRVGVGESMAVAQPVDAFGEAEEARTGLKAVEPVADVVAGGLGDALDQDLVGPRGALQ
jgi:hypothetical protein